MLAKTNTKITKIKLPEKSTPKKKKNMCQAIVSLIGKIAFILPLEVI